MRVPLIRIDKPISATSGTVMVNQEKGVNHTLDQLDLEAITVWAGPWPPVHIHGKFWTCPSIAFIGAGQQISDTRRHTYLDMV